MEREEKTLCADRKAGVLACRFCGTVRGFPRHFHDDYVLGLVEDGSRRLVCRGREYVLGRGDVLVLAPGEAHGCAEDASMDYLSFQVERSSMERLTAVHTGRAFLPLPLHSVVHDGSLARLLRSVFLALHDGESAEEPVSRLAQMLLEHGTAPRAAGAEQDGVTRACAFMREHCTERLGLEQLCAHTSLSRSSLLRAFSRRLGITPYRYLEALRVERARRLLEGGVMPAQAALLSGFADQSHLTNFFTLFTGVTPGRYRELFSADRSHRIGS